MINMSTDMFTVYNFTRLSHRLGTATTALIAVLIFMNLLRINGHETM